MANEKSGWDKFRNREKERLKEDLKRTGETAEDNTGLIRTGSQSALLEKELTQLDLSVDQVNGKVQQYLAGVEKGHPGKLMTDLQTRVLELGSRVRAAPTPMLQFRAQQLVQKFRTFEERWKRLLEGKK